MNNTIALLVGLGLVAPLLAAQDPGPVVPASVLSAEDDAHSPYVLRFQALDETSAPLLREALARLPGVEEVEVFAGNRRSARVHMRERRYVSREQVNTAARRHGIELEELEIPQWARFAVYVVEASGGA